MNTQYVPIVRDRITQEVLHTFMRAPKATILKTETLLQYVDIVAHERLYLPMRSAVGLRKANLETLLRHRTPVFDREDADAIIQAGAGAGVLFLYGCLYEEWLTQLDEQSVGLILPQYLTFWDIAQEQLLEERIDHVALRRRNPALWYDVGTLAAVYGTPAIEIAAEVTYGALLLCNESGVQDAPDVKN